MRLIDADKLMDLLHDPDRYGYICDFDVMDTPTARAIPIEWLHRKLIDLLYDGKAKEETIHVFHQLIGTWEKENESNASD